MCAGYNCRHLKTGRHVPGTGQNGQEIITAVEISNKGILKNILENKKINAFSAVKTHTFIWPEAISDIRCLDGFHFPLIIKPTVKDDSDSFGILFPSKVLILRNQEEFANAMDMYAKKFAHREFLAQEIIEGQNLSWFGAVKNGTTICSYGIRSLVKSPGLTFGGTTTLAQIIPTPPYLASAAAKLAAHLQLDGMFEIEF